MEREIGEDATNNSSDQVVNQFRGRQMRRGEIFSSLNKYSAMHRALHSLLFLFILIHPLIVQLLIIEVSSFATEK
jgi:hypothetical protein